MVTAFFLWQSGKGAHPRDAKNPAPYPRLFTGNFDGPAKCRSRSLEDYLECYHDAAVVAEAKLDPLIELFAQKHQEPNDRPNMHLADNIMYGPPTKRVSIHFYHPKLPLSLVMPRSVYARPLPRPDRILL